MPVTAALMALVMAPPPKREPRNWARFRVEGNTVHGFPVVDYGHLNPMAWWDTKEEAEADAATKNAAPPRIAGMWLLLSEDDYEDFHATERATYPDPPTSYPCFGKSEITGQDCEDSYTYLYPEHLYTMIATLLMHGFKPTEGEYYG